MFMTQQEASGPSPAGRKPEQLLPETFGSTFHWTKGRVGATNGPRGAWFLLERFWENRPPLPPLNPASYVDNCSFVWTTGFLFSPGADTNYHNECDLLRGAEQRAKRDELGWTHTLWSKAGNTINIHQLSCCPHTHLHICESHLNTRLERDRSFPEHGTFEVQHRDSFKARRDRGTFDSPSSPLHPDFCLLAQTHPQSSVHPTDTVVDNESACQHTLLCQHTRSKTTLVHLRKTKAVRKDVINCWSWAVAQLCTFLNTYSICPFTQTLTPESTQHSIPSWSLFGIMGTWVLIKDQHWGLIISPFTRETLMKAAFQSEECFSPGVVQFPQGKKLSHSSYLITSVTKTTKRDKYTT